MAKQDELALVTKIIGMYLGLPPNEIRPTMLLREELGLDSLDMAELLTNIEERTGARLMHRIWDATNVAGLAGVLDAERSRLLQPEQY